MNRPSYPATASAQIIRLSATEIARQISAGALSATEVVEAHIVRIEAVNPALNALVVPLFDRARAAAAADAARSRGEPTGPLAGVPFTVKESFDIAGTPTTLGLSTRTGHRASTDAFLVTRLRWLLAARCCAQLLPREVPGGARCGTVQRHRLPAGCATGGATRCQLLPRRCAELPRAVQFAGDAGGGGRSNARGRGRGIGPWGVAGYRGPHRVPGGAGQRGPAGGRAGGSAALARRCGACGDGGARGALPLATWLSHISTTLARCQRLCTFPRP